MISLSALSLYMVTDYNKLWIIIVINTYFKIIASQRIFLERSGKKPSVGGADKLCISMNKNFHLGPIFFLLSGFCL